MNLKGKYAIIKYIPDIDRDEKINVGIVFHVPSKEFLETKIIKNFNRIKHFDDELDLQYLEIYLKAIKEEFTYSLKFIEREISINNENLLEDLSINYVNQFIFDIHSINIDNSIRKTFEDLYKFMLHYDLEKSQRMNENQKKNFIQKILKSNSIDYEILKRNNNLIGRYNENIYADFKINDYYIKILEFNERNYKNYMDKIKMWAFNSMELKKKSINLIFVVDDNMKNERTQRYIQILEEYSKIIDIESIDNSILKLAKIGYDNNKTMQI